MDPGVALLVVNLQICLAIQNKAKVLLTQSNVRLFEERLEREGRVERPEGTPRAAGWT
jgi:hypothetical protein